MWGPADAALSHCGGMRMRIWEGGQEVLAHAGKRSRSARDPQRIYPPLEVRESRPAKGVTFCVRLAGGPFPTAFGFGGTMNFGRARRPVAGRPRNVSSFLTFSGPFSQPCIRS
jgi:hypothetical protein